MWAWSSQREGLDHKIESRGAALQSLLRNRMPSASPARIAGICRYPVKGLTPEPLPRVALKAGQTLPSDRRYAIENSPSGFDTPHPNGCRKPISCAAIGHSAMPPPSWFPLMVHQANDRHLDGCQCLLWPGALTTRPAHIANVPSKLSAVNAWGFSKC
jgi:MOSC N-terminal beta barrel domain